MNGDATYAECVEYGRAVTKVAQVFLVALSAGKAGIKLSSSAMQKLKKVLPEIADTLKRQPVGMTEHGFNMTIPDTKVPDIRIEQNETQKNFWKVIHEERQKVEGKGNLTLPEMKIDDNQFGRKVGKHAEDYGLDPKHPDSRQWVRNHIEDIRSNYDEVRSGTWNGLGNGPPNARGRGPAVFYKQGNDVIVTDPQGNFVTILKDGINNTSFKSGEVLK